MTVSSSLSTQTFSCNGSTTVFTCPFRVLEASELVGYLITVATNESAPLVNGADFTVTGVGATNAVATTAAAYSSAYTINFRRRTQRLQSTDYRDNDPFPAESHENAIDRLTHIAQENDADIARALLAPEPETGITLPSAAERAGLLLGFDSLGQPVAVAPASGSAADLALNLADSDTTSKGSGQIGHSAGIAYAFGTLGFALNLTVYAELYAQGGDTSQAQAFQRAIDAMAALGGGVVMTRLRTISFDQAVVGKPNVKVIGLGINASTITTTAHTFHAFTDNNTAAPGFEVHGFTIQGPSAPTGGTHTNRGILLDAQGSSYSTRNRFSNLRFRRLFRGLNVHQADDLAYDLIEGEDLLDSVVYVGEVAANRSTRISHGRVYAKNCLTYAGGFGGGGSVIAYADGVECAAGTYVTCGPSSGAINLHHSLYLRSVRGVEVALQTCQGQKRGAGLHVFSDTGEIRCADVSAAVISDDAADYVGVRVAACDGFTLRAGSRISDSAFQGVYLSDCKRATIEEGVLLANNNVSAVTSSVGSAAIRADGCSDLVADGVTALDDTSTAGQYGQGTFLALEGVCPRPRVSNCKHIFPAGAVGYYFAAFESGSAVTHPSFLTNFQDGPQNFLIESGTAVPAGQGLIHGHTRVSAATAPLLSVEQMHRWRVRDCWNEGARWAYESDGINVLFWGSSDPATGTWAVGDRWQRAAPAAGGTTGGRCVTAGTPGVWKAESNLAA